MSETSRNGASAQIHLLVGPVGAGKSTYAAHLARLHRAVSFDLDAWMTTLFAADRPAGADMPERMRWYTERTSRCNEQIWAMTRATLDVGVDVVLEIGLIRRADRFAFYERVDMAGLPMTVYLLDAPREMRRDRVVQRNEQRGATFNMHVPMDVFEMASDLWESPDEAERQRWAFRDI